jgi:hypothetical protein
MRAASFPHKPRVFSDPATARQGVLAFKERYTIEENGGYGKDSRMGIFMLFIAACERCGSDSIQGVRLYSGGMDDDRQRCLIKIVDAAIVVS